MRGQEEMMKIVLDFAEKDERIRLVCLDGSRADKDAVQDGYSDFDIVFFVTDIRPFTQNQDWLMYFGDILILQRPMDWYGAPYDYHSRAPYNLLTQFIDGNRIDFRLVDLSDLRAELENHEPRQVLLKKDEWLPIESVESNDAYFVPRPSEKEFHDCCNEFWWISLNTLKGLCREEFYYAKQMYEHYQMEMLIKMLSWKAVLPYDFHASVGKCGKYLKRFLSKEEMGCFQGLFPNGEYKDIWNKFLLSLTYFEELSSYVAQKLSFSQPKERSGEIKRYIKEKKQEYDKGKE
jgi:aminoglycoside 6-adenylyltransferase